MINNKRILHFVEDAGILEIAFPAANVTAITILNNQGIRIWFKNSYGITNDHRVDVTTTLPNLAEELADHFAQLIAPDSRGYIHTTNEGDTISIGGTGVKINTITYNVGA